MEQQKTLLQLYQLLWEQIKDKPRVYSLPATVHKMPFAKIISFEESNILISDLYIQANIKYVYSGTKNRKQFVQRMIETLTKEQSI